MSMCSRECRIVSRVVGTLKLLCELQCVGVPSLHAHVDRLFHRTFLITFRVSRALALRGGRGPEVDGNYCASGLTNPAAEGRSKIGEGSNHGGQFCVVYN